MTHALKFWAAMITLAVLIEALMIGRIEQRQINLDEAIEVLRDSNRHLDAIQKSLRNESVEVPASQRGLCL